MKIEGCGFNKCEVRDRHDPHSGRDHMTQDAIRNLIYGIRNMTYGIRQGETYTLFQDKADEAEARLEMSTAAGSLNKKRCKLNLSTEPRVQMHCASIYSTGMTGHQARECTCCDPRVHFSVQYAVPRPAKLRCFAFSLCAY